MKNKFSKIYFDGEWKMDATSYQTNAKHGFRFGGNLPNHYGHRKSSNGKIGGRRKQQ